MSGGMTRMEAATKYSDQYHKCKDIAATLHRKVHFALSELGRFYVEDADELVELINCLLEEESELRERYVDLMIVRDNEYDQIRRAHGNNETQVHDRCS